jgi:transcriptional regulator with XRE-family HTH domain
MRKIKEVLRLRFELKMGQREIARACSISQSTVHEYLKAATAAGDELAQSYNEAKAEWKKIDLDLLKWAVPTVAGGLATGLLSLGLPAAGFAVAGVGELIQAHMKRTNFRQTVPMSIFIDLGQKS